MAVLTVSIDGDQQIKLQFRRMHAQIADPRPAYGEAAKWFLNQERKIFRTEGKEYPPRWAALSPDYAARKMREVGRKPILEYSGALKKDLTQRPFGIEVITKSAATFGTDIDYAIHHQRGTPFMPARPPLVKSNNQSQRRLQRIMQAYLKKWWG